MFPQAFTVNELAGFQSGITVIYLERITVLSCIYFASIVFQIERFTIKITHQTVWLAVTENFTRLVGWFSWLSEGLLIQLLYRAMKNWARKYMSQKTFTMWALKVACLILSNSADVISIDYACSKTSLKTIETLSSSNGPLYLYHEVFWRAHLCLQWFSVWELRKLKPKFCY